MIGSVPILYDNSFLSRHSRGGRRCRNFNVFHGSWLKHHWDKTCEDVLIKTLKIAPVLAPCCGWGFSIPLISPFLAPFALAWGDIMLWRHGTVLGGLCELLVAPIYKPFRSFGRGPTTPVRGWKQTMVIIHLLTGMILQIGRCRKFQGTETINLMLDGK